MLRLCDWRKWVVLLAGLAVAGGVAKLTVEVEGQLGELGVELPTLGLVLIPLGVAACVLLPAVFLFGSIAASLRVARWAAGVPQPGTVRRLGHRRR